MLLFVLLILLSAAAAAQECIDDGDCPSDEQKALCDGDVLVTIFTSYSCVGAPNGTCAQTNATDTQTCEFGCVDGACLEGGCSVDGDCDDGDCTTHDTCTANNTCSNTPLTECPQGVDCPALSGFCAPQTCYVISCSDGCVAAPLAEGETDDGCAAPSYCDGAGECVLTPACAEDEEISDECRCGGEVVSSGYCCDNVSRSSACGEIPSYCDDDDEDGYYEEGPDCPLPVDCDDDDPNTYPNATDICENDVDEDCDGEDRACERCDDGTIEGECNHESALCVEGELVFKCTVCGCDQWDDRVCSAEYEVCVVQGTIDDDPDDTNTTPVAGCTPEWSCTEWSSCEGESMQRRTCTDANACGTDEGKPSTGRFCSSRGTDQTPDTQPTNSSSTFSQQRASGSREQNLSPSNVSGHSNSSAVTGDTQGFIWPSWLLFTLSLTGAGAVVLVAIFVLRRAGPAGPSPKQAREQAQWNSINSLAARIQHLRGQLDEAGVDAQLAQEEWMAEVIAAAKARLSAIAHPQAREEIPPVEEDEPPTPPS